MQGKVATVTADTRPTAKGNAAALSDARRAVADRKTVAAGIFDP